MPISEILANVSLALGILTMAGMCFWTIYALDRDDKKPKHKTKKA